MNDTSREGDLIECIAQYDAEFKKWVARAEKIVKRYRADGRKDSSGLTVNFPILWSNVQTLVPATFSRLPRPDVSRRFRDNDPVGRVAALILERALEYEVQHYPDYAATMNQDVLDRFLGGRGTAWVRYEPHFRAMPNQPTDGLGVTEDIDEPNEELDYECSPCDYVNYKDFGHSVARTWEEVTKVWRIVYMSKDAVTERFGEEWAAKIPYDSSPDKKDRIKSEQTGQAKIYEIWDKESNTACWLSKSLGKIIEEREDPLQLAQFWPCPRPLFATLSNETLVPVPDFVLYQDQADELDVLSERIDGLIKSLQVKGVHDASNPALGRLFTEGTNGDLLPVENWSQFAEKNGLKGGIDIIDLTPIFQALVAAQQAFAAQLEKIYEITGISDIIRGSSNPNETLGAQQIKQNFAGLRLKNMQADVAKFAGELLCLKAQIICGKYSPQTIVKISAADQLSPSDQQYIQPAIELLIGPERMQDPEAEQGPNPLRAFRIDVEADSLVQMDEQQDKQDRMEFLQAVGAYVREALPVIQSSPEAAPLLVSLLKYGVTGFKIGKTIEGDFDQALDQLKQAAAQPKEPPPNPEMQKMQMQQQADAARLQADQQAQQARIQADMFIEQQRMAAEERQAEREAILKANEMQMQQRFDMQAAMMEQQFARFEAMLKAKTAVEVAEISAGASIGAAQISGADDAVE